MKSTIRLAAAMTLTGAMFSGYAAAADITGAGATFPYPLYAKWAEAYKAQTGVGMNYQSIGSGGGIKQIQSKTVDFGASDKPLTADELNKAGLTQFPAVMGGVVPVINLPGVTAGQLKVTGPLLADIYLGKVSKWNDPAIASLNPGVKLPDQQVRAGSGHRHRCAERMRRPPRASAGAGRRGKTRPGWQACRRFPAPRSSSG